MGRLFYSAAAPGGGGGGGNNNNNAGGSGGDPLFSYQWHLHNTGQAGRTGYSATSGEDLNVKALWDSCPAGGCRGENVLIAVVDDGLEIAHEDLAANIAAGKSYDFTLFVDGAGGDPTPDNSDDSHGTMVGGIIAARDDNGIGVRGVASRAKLAGYNLLQNGTTTNTALAMTHNSVEVAVSNNSWGPTDGTGHLSPSDITWREAIEQGLLQGRDGNGTVYIWAGGNGYDEYGGYVDDDSNLDGYANFYGVIAAAALNARGKRASYSEPGANILVSGFGGEYCSSDGLAIATTDLSGNGGLNNGSYSYDLANRSYTRCMNGTSSAAPTVAGVTALVIQANPNLTWRDVRQVLAKSARKNDATDGNWTQNGAGLWFNRQYGFGAADAHAAVNLAKTWTNLGTQKTKEATWTGSVALPTLTFVDQTLDVSSSGISKIEFVEIYVSATHNDTGELKIELQSPSSANRSLLLPPRNCWQDPVPNGSGGWTISWEPCPDLSDWRFGSTQQMDEAADGTWTLRVSNYNSTNAGTLTKFALKIYGH